MRKLDTPPQILFTVALLSIYAVGGFVVAAAERSLVIAATSALAGIAAVGTALLRPWSQYLVYILAPAFIAKFALSVYSSASAGYFAARFETSAGAAQSLLAEALIGLLLVVSCFIVHRHFTTSRSQTRADS